MTEKDLNIKVRDDGVYILETENYRFHLDEKTHIEKIGKIINENEQLKQQEKRLYKYFRKCFDNVSEKGFKETWEVVKNND